jgi:glutathione synthase/RimK-type ligase-like ATP-grasp enzyme
MSRTVLVIGEPDDRHVTEVAGLLAARGVRPLLFDFVRQPVIGGRLTWTLGDGRAGAAVNVDDEWVDLDDVDAVWWRVKLVEGTGVLTRGGSMPDFALREWFAVLDSLEHLAPAARWTNRRSASSVARLKPVQLRVATEVGLAVPRTLVSNDPGELADFSASSSVYKVLTWYYRHPNEMIFTSEVRPGDVLTDPNAVRMAPCLLQERVAKDHELRVTVVGQETVAVRIDSQHHPDARVDWRRAQHDVGYRVVHLESDLERALREMNRRLGLEFGAYDLAVTPDGEPVFFEVNPVGQWLWLEQACNAPISAAVSAHLAEGG